MSTLTEKLAQVVSEAPNKIAMQIKKNNKYVQYTYKELYDHVRSIAYSLMQLKVQPGDKIALILENRPEWSFIYFGILLAGAIAIPIDPQSDQQDLTYFLADSEAKIVFTSSQLLSSIAKANMALVEKIIVLDEDSQNIDALIETKVLSFTKFFACPQADTIWPKILPENLASILYTSGTTGKPKGVQLTHANFYANFSSIEKLKFLSSGHNILSILPLHHSFPFMVSLILPLFSKNKITYLSSLKREEILHCIQETDVTALIGVPQFFVLLAKAIKQAIKDIPFFLSWPLYGLINIGWLIRKTTKINLNKYLLYKIHKLFGKKFKFLVCGGAKLNLDVEYFFDKLGFTLLQGYGLTETAPVVTFNPGLLSKIGSVGKAIPDVAIKIIDPGQHGIGEIAIKGLNVMQGYYKNAVATSAVLKDKWFYSGDLGYLDQDGYLFITGRKKELIVLSSGKNITPELVEDYYSQSRFIKELCVMLIATQDGAVEQLKAVIVPDFGNLRKFGVIDVEAAIKVELEILSKDYPEYKHIMGFIIAKQDLPRTRLGKLKRHLIRAKYQDELSGAEPATYQEPEISAEDLQLVVTPTFKKIAEIIQQEKQISRPIVLADHLGIDLGFDSLSRVELIAVLEKNFNLHIAEQDMANIFTVKELVLMINKLLGQQKPEATVALELKSKEVLWKDLLNAEPDKSITDKIDLAPNQLIKFATFLFCGGLYAIAKLAWRIEVVGVENLPKDTAFVLCPNHAAYLDAFLVAAAMPNWLAIRNFFLGYNVFFDVPVIRDLIKIGRIIPLDPGARLVDALQACGYVLRHGKVICIFPEGGRSVDGSVKPFKKGIGILAKELNVPLVPVYIDGSFQALPRGRVFPRFNKIKIEFGKPCLPDELQQQGFALGETDNYAAIARGIEQQVKILGSLK
ncbi:MAG: AMP-binding protein [Gammaproteobacteria bacterium]|jgi:long-chain acyl-CoA synthetase